LTNNSTNLCILTGFLAVRESQGILRESGKVRENREGQGILKYRSLDQLLCIIFTIFVGFWGLRPQTPPGLCPCKHCRLVYIAIFYDGTKFSITFVYLVLFYWCRE